MQGTIDVLKTFNVEYEVRVSSAHRTPEDTRAYISDADSRGCAVFIAAAGMAAHLAGAVSAHTLRPVIGVPIKSSNSIDGWDSILSILQMPPGIPVATVGLDGARNAGILAAQILGTSDPAIMGKMIQFKEKLANKIVKANEELRGIEYKYKTN